MLKALRLYLERVHIKFAEKMCITFLCEHALVHPELILYPDFRTVLKQENHTAVPAYCHVINSFQS